MFYAHVVVLRHDDDNKAPSRSAHDKPGPCREGLASAEGTDFAAFACFDLLLVCAWVVMQVCSAVQVLSRAAAALQGLRAVRGSLALA